MNRKLIFTDLDGTLLTRDKKIKDESVRIIKALSAQGHYICFMTGRSLADARVYYDQLALQTLCICNNGAAIHNPCDEDFRDIFFPMNKQIMLKLSESPEIMNNVQHFVIKTRHYTFVNKVPTEKHLLENFVTWFHLDFERIKDVKKDALITFKNRKSDILSIILVLKPKTDIKCMYRDIKMISNNLLLTHWSIDNRDYQDRGHIIIELNHNFANKYNALRFVQSYYDVLDADTYVFGDGENDTQPLHSIENSYAMANASSHAMAVAHHITRHTNDENGVAHTLEELFMPK